MLVGADQPVWMTGIVEMTRTFGLELLESMLTQFPSVFSKHAPFRALLKERVCSLVIKLFSPNIKYNRGSGLGGGSGGQGGYYNQVRRMKFGYRWDNAVPPGSILLLIRCYSIS